MSKLPKLFNFLKMKMKVLGVRRFIFLLLSLTALTEDVHTRMMTKKCMRIADCGEDYICSEGICHSCLDCGLLLREGPSCVVDFKQCGSCLKGYKDFPITDFSTVMKPCEQIESKPHSQECLNDHHCPFDNYCHEKSCVKCFDCSLYNRLPPTQNCAKEPQDCSSCLNGFYEVPVTTEVNTKPCQKIMSHSTENVSSTQFELSQDVALVVLCLFEVLVIVVVLVVRRQAGGSKQLIEVRCNSPRPPPYSSDICRYVREPEPEVEEESSFFTFVEEEKHQQNTAKVFRLPQAPYYYENEDEIENLTENSLDDEEDANFNAVYVGSNVHLFNDITESDSVATPPEEVYGFEVINESEVNIATLSDVNSTDPTSIDVTNATEESTLEEGKNHNEGEVLEQKEKNDLTE